MELTSVVNQTLRCAVCDVNFDRVYDLIPDFQFDRLASEMVVDEKSLRIIAARHRNWRCDSPLLPVLMASHRGELIGSTLLTREGAYAVLHLLTESEKLELFMRGTLSIESCTNLLLTEKQVISWIARNPNAEFGERVRVILHFARYDSSPDLNMKFVMALPHDMRVIYATCLECKDCFYTDEFDSDGKFDELAVHFNTREL